jgi:hypothetical protein
MVFLSHNTRVRALVPESRDEDGLTGRDRARLNRGARTGDRCQEPDGTALIDAAERARLIEERIDDRGQPSVDRPDRRTAPVGAPTTRLNARPKATWRTASSGRSAGSRRTSPTTRATLPQPATGLPSSLAPPSGRRRGRACPAPTDALGYAAIRRGAGSIGTTRIVPPCHSLSRQLTCWPLERRNPRVCEGSGKRMMGFEPTTFCMANRPGRVVVARDPHR